MVCCFFGHRNTPNRLRPLLREEILRVLEEDRETRFYVGTQGNFDWMALSVLEELKKSTPSLNFAAVLAYLPKKRPEWENPNLPPPFDTVYPEGLETVPPKFAISARNRWMATQADVVICYKTYDRGGAAQFVNLAARKGKKIINLADKIENTAPHLPFEEVQKTDHENHK